MCKRRKDEMSNVLLLLLHNIMEMIWGNILCVDNLAHVIHGLVLI